jgi:hypothetical protein
LLAGLPPQFEIRTEAEKWQGAFKAAQGAIREQGQVMSAALDNNRSLWETNKKLRAERVTLLESCARLERERNEFERMLRAIPEDIQERAMLQMENDALKQANALLRSELVRTVTPELNSDQLRERLAEMKAQAGELQATGLVPTAEELARADHARDAQAAEFKRGE